ncbi:ABC transporter ATP-binding protein [Lacrimispora aerotolerans]|uniref:ABC transporter ATP-binding protein n=1 Tax=Lacrimispora aerotolerans TaxID=36832 RepID=UPI00047D3BBB|nr:ABC transporter ATP-binding protein [Lacrimispora aerotolerans]
MKKLIEAEGIVKVYDQGGEAQTVLSGVSLEIGEGEFAAVMGPSGSGKSTLLYVLSGMDPADGGTITFDGRALDGLSEDALADLRRSKIGFVFQQPTLLKNLNILDNILLPTLRDHKKDSQRLKKRAKELMDGMGIGELSQREITKVSGGQLQRAGICRALMSQPRIIMADEPTGALNSKTAQEIMDIFERINREGTALLLVTHDPKVAARAGRVLFMSDGQIVNELRFQNKDEMAQEKNLLEVMEKMKELGI